VVMLKMMVVVLWWMWGCDDDDTAVVIVAWRVAESDGGDRIDREMGRIFGVGRKSSPENFSGGCGGGRRLPN
ncbi:hypothetical protein Tco_0470168, partial [Tanacetum coccineum]